MAKPADLEDLLQLKARGIIDDAEFSARKKLLARRSLRAYSQSKAKSGILYIFFAYFLGMTGLHNFYAGYWGRGLAQLLLSLTSPLFLYIPVLIVGLMVVGEIWFVNHDAGKRPFSGSRSVIWFLRILSIASLAYAFNHAELVGCKYNLTKF